MSVLTLVRHGQASFGAERYDRLSPLGERQAEHLRQHFEAIGHLPHRLIAGRLDRQQSTARILAGSRNVELVIDDAFDEYDAGTLLRLHAERHGTSIADLMGDEGRIDARRFQRRLETVGLAWVAGELAAPTLERWPEFRSRVGRGLATVMDQAGRGTRVIVCTSAGVIGAAVGELLGLDDRETLKLSWSVHNSSMTQILFDGERRSLRCFNTVPHLEHPERRNLLTYR